MKRIVLSSLILLAVSAVASASPSVFFVGAPDHTKLAPLGTGIMVGVGDSLVMSASTSDTWVLGDSNPYSRECNADGLSTYPDYSYGGLTARYGTMVGQIDSGAFFLIGTSFSGTAASAGELKLLCWDSYYSDNDGSIRLEVTDTPAVPAPGALLLGGLGTCLVGWLRRKSA